MLHPLLTTFAIAAVAAILPAQKGTVVRIDKDAKTIQVKVGDHEYEAKAADIKLLDADGNKAELTDFAADDAIIVTLEKDRVTVVQKAPAKLDLRAVGDKKGKVVSTDGKKGEILIKVGKDSYLLTAKDITMKGPDGKKAELADFAAGDAIAVTFDGNVVTAIQKSKA